MTVGESFFNGAYSYSINGYTRLPNGFIFAMGHVGCNQGLRTKEVEIIFPTPFPNQCFNVQATRKIASHTTEGDGEVHFISATTIGASFSLNHDAQTYSSLRGFTWLAIGH